MAKPAMSTKPTKHRQEASESECSDAEISISLERGLTTVERKSFIQQHHCNKGCGNVLTSIKNENECLRKGHRTQCKIHLCTYIDYCIQCRNELKRKEQEEAQEKADQLMIKKEEASRAEATDFDKADEAQAFRDGNSAIHAYKLLTPNQRKRKDIQNEKIRKAQAKAQKAAERREKAEAAKLERQEQKQKAEEWKWEQDKRARAQHKGGKRLSDLGSALSQKANGDG